jgi:acyl carrier protein
MADTLERVRKIVIEHLDADPEKVTRRRASSTTWRRQPRQRRAGDGLRRRVRHRDPDDAAETIQTVGDAVTFIDGDWEL